MQKQISIQVYFGQANDPTVAITRNKYRKTRKVRYYRNVNSRDIAHLIFAIRNTHHIFAHCTGWSAQPDRTL